MGIDILRTPCFDKLRKKALEEYFTYDAKIKNYKDTMKIIDKVIIPSKEQTNGK